MYKCHFEGCDRSFNTEPARNGHLGCHKTKKRAPAIKKRFVRKKYDENPTRGGLTTDKAEFPPSHRRRPAAKHIDTHTYSGLQMENGLKKENQNCLLNNESKDHIHLRRDALMTADVS